MYKVPLARPSLPPKQDFLKIMDELWETRMLSNFSKHSQIMEKSAKEYFHSERPNQADKRYLICAIVF